MIHIRSAVTGDLAVIADLVAITLRTTNSKDYTKEYIEGAVISHSASILAKRAAEGHMYVACDENELIGCGTVMPYCGSSEESVLRTIFVLPAYQGKGIGRMIMAALEQDEFFLRAKRVEIPASVTACSFYRALGYSPKNGIAVPDEDGCIKLEKYR